MVAELERREKERMAKKNALPSEKSMLLEALEIAETRAELAEEASARADQALHATNEYAEAAAEEFAAHEARRHALGHARVLGMVAASCMRRAVQAWYREVLLVQHEERHSKQVARIVEVNTLARREHAARVLRWGVLRARKIRVLSIALRGWVAAKDEAGVEAARAEIQEVRDTYAAEAAERTRQSEEAVLSTWSGAGGKPTDEVTLRLRAQAEAQQLRQRFEHALRRFHASLQRRGLERALNGWRAAQLVERAEDQVAELGRSAANSEGRQTAAHVERLGRQAALRRYFRSVGWALQRWPVQPFSRLGLCAAHSLTSQVDPGSLYRCSESTYQQSVAHARRKAA